MVLFSGMQNFCFPVAGLFSRFRLRGKQEGYLCTSRYVLRVRVCCCKGLCICVLEPGIFNLFFFALLLAAAAVRVMSVSRAMFVSRRPSSSQALYFVAAMVQQQAHMKWSLLRRPRTVHQFVRACRAMFPMKRTHNPKRISHKERWVHEVHGRCQKERGYTIPHFLGILKATAQPRQQSRNGLNTSKPWYSTSTYVASTIPATISL